ILQEGADNGRMWGLHLDFETFFRLELSGLPDAYFIFVYEDAARMDPAQAPYLARIAELAAADPDACLLINGKQIARMPDVVLSHLPFRRHEKLVLPSAPKTDEDEDDEADETPDARVPEPEV